MAPSSVASSNLRLPPLRVVRVVQYLTTLPDGVSSSEPRPCVSVSGAEDGFDGLELAHAVALVGLEVRALAPGKRRTIIIII